MELIEQATTLHQEGRLEEAEALYELLLTQNHANADLMATMGTLYLQRKKYGLAIYFLHNAMQGMNGTERSDILSNLSLAYKGTGQYDKAVEIAEKACTLGEVHAESWANLSGYFTNTGTPDKSIELCERALAKKPELVIAHWNLALALLEKGEWARGWDEHEWGLKKVANASPMRVDRGIDRIPYWDGTPGKNLWVYGEQGIGDEIMFASILPDLLKQNGVVFECHKRLKHLFEHSFPSLPCYGTREDTAIEWPSDHNLHYYVSIGTLGKYFRRSWESFPGTPYLHADPIERSKRFRIGISWQGGGSKVGRVITRSIPLSWWQEIFSQDAEFVSLQYTECEDEINKMESLGYEIKQYPGIKADDYYETARVVQSCDLVISICTSVIHLAGALGVPCWVLVPNRPAWRYGISGKMAWYRSVRLYRQPNKLMKAGDPPDQGLWMPVLDKVAVDLSDLIKIRSELAA